MPTPKLTSPCLPVQRLAAGRRFHFDLSAWITPKTDLNIEIFSPYLSWLHIETNGQASGTTPETRILQQYWMRVHITHPKGKLTTGFLLQIVPMFTPSIVSPNIPSPMLKPLSPLLPQTYDFVDYINEYFHVFAKDEWNQLLYEESKKQGKNVGKQPSIKDAKNVINTMNPNIEKHLRAQCQDLISLTSVELTKHEFINLFRQGSQPTGAIVPVVFNYLAAPNPHNFSHTRNVLDAAALKIIDLVEKNQMTHEKKHQLKHS